MDELGFIGALPRRSSVQHFVKNNAIGEDIGLIAVSILLESFKRHIERRANIKNFFFFQVSKIYGLILFFNGKTEIT